MGRPYTKTLLIRRKHGALHEPGLWTISVRIEDFHYIAGQCTGTTATCCLRMTTLTWV